MSLLAAAVDALAIVPTLIPDPDPVAPPGAEGPVTQILGWAKWVALIVAVLGIIAVAAMFIWSSSGRAGEGGSELFRRLLFVFVGVILVSSAVSIIGFVSGA